MKEGDRVMITGIGMVTPLGASAPDCAAGWVSGASARRRRAAELAGTRLEAAEVADTPLPELARQSLDQRLLKYMSQGAVLGCLAAHEAIEDAALSRRFRPERVGLFAATGLAAANLSETLPMVAAAVDATGSFSPKLLGKRGLRAASPVLSFRLLANMAACMVSIIESIRGPSYIFTPWEGQGGAALVEAWRAVAAGEVDAAVAGASDTAAEPPSLVLLSQRGHLVDGELAASGAGYLVLERARSARRDGIAGYCCLADASLACQNQEPCDPLAPRMGRAFAAAPAILLGLAAYVKSRTHTSPLPTVISGVDGQEFRFALEAVP
ncbi:MAG: beta-ketoacyl synthase N-terminal-like domain-containing protein [Armatimonadota bacterium]